MTERYELTPHNLTRYSDSIMDNDIEQSSGRRNNRESGRNPSTQKILDERDRLEGQRRRLEREEEERQIRNGQQDGGRQVGQESQDEEIRKLREESERLRERDNRSERSTQRQEQTQAQVLSAAEAVPGAPPEVQRDIADARLMVWDDENVPSDEIRLKDDALHQLKADISQVSPENINELKTIFLDGGKYTTQLNDLVFNQKKQRVVSEAYEKDAETRAKTILKFIDEKNVNAAKNEALKAITYLQFLRDRYTEKRQRIDVNSIEQLAQLIIQTDPELWGERFPLVDAEGNINQANFLNWIRESMLWHHDNDSDNPSLNFWNLIEVSTPYRNINLASMLRQRGKFFRTRDGIDLDELREQITREVWLFNTSRNNHLQYRAVMHSDSDLNSEIKKMFYTSTFTKNAFGKSTLRWILTMPEEFRASHSQKTSSEQKNAQADANVGEGVRTAFLTYYHLSDYNRLVDILGKDAPLLSRDAYEKYIIQRELGALKEEMRLKGFDVSEEDELKEKGMAINTKYIEDKKKREGELEVLIKENSTTSDSQKIQAKWLGSREGGAAFALDQLFDKNGKPLLKDFSDFINIYTGPETNSQNISVVRSLIRDSLANVYKDPEAERKGASTREAEFSMPRYAEAWAYSMTRWTGAAARNDVGARAYDKWTELQLTLWKRKRDSRGTRAGGAGNPYNFGMFHALSPDLFNGMVLQHDKKTAPYELMWDIEEKRQRKENYDIHKELEVMEFTDNAMGQFAAVHLDNAFNFLGILMDAQELDFEKFMTIDKYGRRVFNQADYQESLGKFFKTVRNAYSTWGQINFATPVRVLKSNGNPPVYETKSVAEMMFGNLILDIPEFKKDGKFEPSLINGTVKDKHGHVLDGKTVLWKQIVKGFLAAQITAHRDLKSGYPHYDYHTIETIYETLESIPGEIVENDTDISKTVIKDHAFSHDDISWIRKHSKTGSKKMFWIEMGAASVRGTVSATKEIVDELIDALKTK